MRQTKKNYTEIVLCFILTFSSMNMIAQNNYEALYRISEPKIQGSLENLSERGRQMAKRYLDKAKEIKYSLSFNETTSYFEVEQGLTKDFGSQMDNILTSAAKKFASFNEKVYSKHKEKRILFIRNLVNKDFFVEGDYLDFKWIVTQESKEILGLKAIKAIGEYFDPTINETSNIIAWFIPSIPISTGPDIFNGLPGLIGEIDLRGATVTLDSLKKSNITVMDDSKIKKEKVYTYEEYKILLGELTEKFIND